MQCAEFVMACCSSPHSLGLGALSEHRLSMWTVLCFYVCPVPGVSGRITGTNLSTGKTVVFYQVLPVTREEIDYKDEHGSSELIGHIFGDDNVLETIINRLKIQ